jgi:hypothetical protein
MHPKKSRTMLPIVRLFCVWVTDQAEVTNPSSSLAMMRLT